MLKSARLITCKRADSTREGQARGNRIAGDDGLADIGRLPEGFLAAFWKRTITRRRFTT